MELSDKEILTSWQINAAPWTQAVREKQIASRRLVTDQAVVETVLSHHPQTVLDLGCGEGWLSRALNAHGLQLTGVDAIPELIAMAQTAGGGNFQTLTYEQLAAGALKQHFDLVVSNFALIGKEAVEGLFQTITTWLNPGGHVVVQTLHPVMACGSGPYQNGWQSGSWEGFSEAFSHPAPWYFRTIGSWVALFIQHDLELVNLIEPVHPETGQAVSLILVGRTRK